MRLDRIAEIAIGRVLGRLVRRTLIALAAVAFAIVAIGYFTVAGTLALELSYSALEARLIVGAIYAVIAIALMIAWAVWGKRSVAAAPALSGQRDMQIAMLVEAATLGYVMARKTGRTG